jgi:hypothetical protein
MGSSPEAWQSAYSKVSGSLPLDELRMDSTPTVVILQGEIDVKTSDRIGVTVTSTEKFQTWFDTESFEGRSPFEVTPSPGRHTITLRVEITEHEQPELRVEFTTPEKSAALFEVIGGA